ncbi:MAG: Branched-chain amino acid transport ATP-binding protein LivG [Candidatus Carbobacillus altaicus]|uniref:Branched-chain amino acid transport ATP-binding protein LivG n=1 Tax=Candidatus Carbonibacillus altaicus TaxID=2163959 RepID=A0A2R6XY68_9BACL|nr:MAG: Branched-chain amino acid transport ATP-binding protein LivG [Candidatus Carbobacillus altaicus]
MKKDSPVLLSLQAVSKRFGGLKALDHVSLDVYEGEILALIGPNGAGKTTLFNVITGHYRPEEGTVFFAGAPITGVKPHRVAELGIGRTFQNLRLFPSLTVLENVLSGRHIKLKSNFWYSLLHTPFERNEEKKAREIARSLLERLGLGTFMDRPVGSLPYGRQKIVEIARALALEPRLLILDEPAAGLNERERVDLVSFILKLHGEGLSILLIEHDMDLVMQLAHRIVVLDNGAVIAIGTPDEIQRNPLVIEAYLGREEEDEAI